MPSRCASARRRTPAVSSACHRPASTAPAAAAVRSSLLRAGDLLLRRAAAVAGPAQRC
jgi:hypothetical protein